MLEHKINKMIFMVACMQVWQKWVKTNTERSTVNKSSKV